MSIKCNKKLNLSHATLNLFTSNAIYILLLSTNSFEYTLLNDLLI